MKEPLIMGDMEIRDDGDLGLSIYDRMKDEKITFINDLGCKALGKWLVEKYELKPID